MHTSYVWISFDLPFLTVPSVIYQHKIKLPLPYLMKKKIISCFILSGRGRGLVTHHWAMKFNRVFIIQSNSTIKKICWKKSRSINTSPLHIRKTPPYNRTSNLGARNFTIFVKPSMLTLTMHSACLMPISWKENFLELNLNLPFDQYRGILFRYQRNLII